MNDCCKRKTTVSCRSSQLSHPYRSSHGCTDQGSDKCSTLSVWLCVEITGATNWNHWSCFSSFCINAAGKQLAEFRVFLVPFSSHHYMRTLFVTISLYRYTQWLMGYISSVQSASSLKKKTKKKKNCAMRFMDF